MIKCLPIIYTILLSFLKASLFLTIYLILNKLNITSNLSDINCIYILNLLTILILSFKIYIGYLNYNSAFNCIFNIYKYTKIFYISYCTIIDYKYIEDDKYTSEYGINDFHDYDNSDYHNSDYEFRGISYIKNSYKDDVYDDDDLSSLDDISSLGDQINDLSISKIKKNNLLYIKEIIILYISHTIYIYTGIYKNSSFFREFKKINSFIFNEIQKNHYEFHYNTKELHSSYIELLILKNLINIKNKNYITSSQYSILYNSFSNLQDSITKMQTLSFKNNKITYLNYVVNSFLTLNLANISLYYIYNNRNNYYYYGLILFIISFIIHFINEISINFIDIFKNFDYIFNCEDYIYNINDELFLLNYLYTNNIEYKI